MPFYENQEYYKNDSFRLGLDLCTNENTPIDLTGASVLMQIKLNNDSTISLVEASTANGLITIGPKNQVNVNVPPVSMNPVVWPNTYYYDIQVTFPGMIVQTIMAGRLIVIKDTSR
jgi:hypothetical protein